MKGNLSAFLGYGLIGGLILLVVYSLGSSDGSVGSYYSDEIDYGVVIESDPYQELESELEEAKYCIEALKDDVQ